MIISVATAAHDAPVNPDDPAYLRRQYAWFQAQDPARQQQLRKLHAEFQNLLPEDQARLTRVMQSYNAWLARLPEADRERVAAAATSAERLEEVKRLRERDWVDSLPKAYRDEFAALDADARRQKIQEWRAEESDRHEEWSLAQKHWAENPPGRIPLIFDDKKDRPTLDAFLAHLRENLNEAERRRLDELRTAADEFGIYFGYAIEIVRLADAHPLLPWSKPGPHDWKELPEEVRNYLQKADPQHFAKPGDEPKELRRAQGRWPEYAWELSNYCAKNGLTLPVPLGDCKRDQMPTDVVLFLKTIEPQLKKSGDAKLLEDAQGKWPDYPKAIMELARKNKQTTLPAWVLPGGQQFWDKHRMPRKVK